MERRTKKSSVLIADVEITHPDKIMFSNPKVTKKMLAEYYNWIAPKMLPDLKSRPLTCVRCPQGYKSRCFYQKHHPDNSPYPTIKIIENDSPNAENYAYINNARDIIELVQLNTVEFHTWGSKVKKVEFPDRIVFDLDPDTKIKASEVKDAALSLKKLLTRLKLKSFVRISGGKGIHVVVPVKPIYTWDSIKKFAHAVAELEAQHNSIITTNMSKAARKGKIFLDYLRNARSSTAIANYSVRSRKGAPIAIPLEWSELKKIKKFNVVNLANAKTTLGKFSSNPWRGIDRLSQTLPLKV